MGSKMADGTPDVNFEEVGALKGMLCSLRAGHGFAPEERIISLFSFSFFFCSPSPSQAKDADILDRRDNMDT